MLTTHTASVDAANKVTTMKSNIAEAVSNLQLSSMAMCLLYN